MNAFMHMAKIVQLIFFIFEMHLISFMEHGTWNMEQFASPKRRSSADRQLLSNPTDKVIQFFSSVFSRNNTNSTTTTTNGLSERKRVVISGIPAGIGNTGPGTQVKQRKVPIKVDPKVYFANERTFLAWLHISVILSSASIAIMALAKENTWSVMYGIILLPVAVSFLVYAMVQCESSPLFIYLLFIYFCNAFHSNTMPLFGSHCFCCTLT